MQKLIRFVLLAVWAGMIHLPVVQGQFSEGSLQISGSVQNKEGSNVQDAEVQLSLQGTEIKRDATNFRGKFSFDLPYDKEFQLVIHKDGYVPKRIDITTFVPAKVKTFNSKYKFAVKLDKPIEKVAGDSKLGEQPAGLIMWNDAKEYFHYDPDITLAYKNKLDSLKALGLSRKERQRILARDKALADSKLKTKKASSASKAKKQEVAVTLPDRELDQETLDRLLKEEDPAAVRAAKKKAEKEAEAREREGRAAREARDKEIMEEVAEAERMEKQEAQMEAPEFSPDERLVYVEGDAKTHSKSRTELEARKKAREAKSRENRAAKQTHGHDFYVEVAEKEKENKQGRTEQETKDTGSDKEKAPEVDEEEARETPTARPLRKGPLIRTASSRGYIKSVRRIYIEYPHHTDTLEEFTYLWNSVSYYYKNGESITHREFIRELERYNVK